MSGTQSEQMLSEIWRQQLSVIFANIVNKKREHEEIANASQLIGADYQGRFLLELLQNGYDAIMKGDSQSGSIAIVKHENFVAVGNHGVPFDQDRVNRIISLAISEKKPSGDIGNKGVGFKSVFEVTKTPIILSALGGRLINKNIGIRFKLLAEPFRKKTRMERLGEVAEVVLSRAHKEDLNEISKINDDVKSVLIDAAQKAAGFKFPVFVRSGEVDYWRKNLPEFDNFVTVVIMPIDENASEKVQDAFDELLTILEEVILFLPGLNEISIYDHLQGNHKIIRRKTEETLQSSGSEQIEKIQTKLKEYSNESPVPKKSLWWVASRDIGARSNNDSESSAIKQVARRFGKKWSEVDSATIRVALPIPWEEGPITRNGFFSIGLPTEHQTGTPFWVDSSFYSTISRKTIDFDYEYNSLLLNTAANLIAVLLECLKKHDDIKNRRLVTFARSRQAGEGKLAEILHSDEGYFNGDCFLGYNGESYVSIGQLCMLEPIDLEIIEMAGQPIDQLEELGFVLADRLIMQHADKVVYENEDWHPTVQMFMNRKSDLSLIESLAKTLVEREAKTTDWEKFLSWILDWSLNEGEEEELRSQCFLPVVGGSLESPQNNVFIPPRSNRIDSGLYEDDEEIDKELSDFPDNVRTLLCFLDEVVHVREPNGRLTKFGRRLCPDEKQGFTRRPRTLNLVRYAVLPSLNQLIRNETNRRKAFKLLETTILLLHGERTETIRYEVQRIRSFRLPTSKGFKWRRAKQLYFGNGWLDTDEERLLKKSVGRFQGRYLIDWQSFKSFSGERSREWWRKGFEWLGVAKVPRVIVHRRKMPATFRATYSGLAIDNPNMPGELPAKTEPYWKKYIEGFEQQDSRYVTASIKYAFDYVAWIDGLEDPQRRQSIVDLILRHPESYEYLSTKIKRTVYNEHLSTEDVLWIKTIKSNGWKIFLAENGERVSAESLWLVNRNEWGPDSKYSHLLSIRPSLYKSESLLQRLGICRLDEGNYKRVIRELHNQAHRLHAKAVESTSRTLLTLVGDLYERLDQLAVNVNNFGEIYSELSGDLIPLLRSNNLIPVDLASLSSLFIEDDKERRLYIKEAKDGYFLPIKSKKRYKNLPSLIGRSIDVKLTSRAPLGIRMENKSEPERLLDILYESGSDDLLVALGCIIAYCSQVHMEPGKERFNEKWQQLKDLEVRFVDMGEGAPGAIKEISDNDDSKLMLFVQRGSDKANSILLGLWQVLGTGYKYVLKTFADSFKKGAVKEFLENDHIGPQEEQSVREVVLQTRKNELIFQYPSLLLIMRKNEPHVKAEELQSLMEHTQDLQAALNIIVKDETNNIFGEMPSDPISLSLFLADWAGFTVDDWQKARVELNEQRYLFPDARNDFCKTRQRSYAMLKAQMVRKLDDDTKEPFKNFLENFSRAEPSGNLPYRPQSDSETRDCLLENAHFYFPDAQEDKGVIRKLIHDWEQKDTKDPALIPPLSKLEVEEYEHNDNETKLSYNATDTKDEYLKVILLLASEHNEKIDSIQNNSRLKILSESWWANKYILLQELGRILKKESPKIWSTLREINAFSRALSSSELCSKLGLENKKKEDDGPKKKTYLGNVELSDNEVDADLSKGSLGQIGRALQSKVNKELDLKALSQRARKQISTEKTTGKKVFSTKRYQPRSRGDDDITGAVGEAFVYEYLCENFGENGFDHTCWKSENKFRYLGIVGSEKLGYDFEWFDSQGLLVSAEQRCLIEVKATKGKGPHFPISTTEWERAKVAHSSPDETYIIVPVISAQAEPEISDILIDPVQMELDGELVIENFDGWIKPGRPLK